MPMHHIQVGSIHIFILQRLNEEGFENTITIKAQDYKHTILHVEPDIKDAKTQAIQTAEKLGLITEEDANEALKLL